MKWNFLYQITAASRTPDYGATAPRSPFSCPLSWTEFVEPPPNKIPGYATDYALIKGLPEGAPLYQLPRSGRQKRRNLF
jgi:hypothetical protein